MSSDTPEVASEALADDTFQPEDTTGTPNEAQNTNEEIGNLINELFPGAGDTPDPQMIELLSNGLLSRFLPSLTKTQADLKELTENQRIQIETILQENAKFSESAELQEVKATMEKGKTYHEKLIKIKREMHQLHEKSAKLKKRAIVLQQQRQKQELHDEHQRELQAARERELIAKPARTAKPENPATTVKPADPANPSNPTDPSSSPADPTSSGNQS